MPSIHHIHIFPLKYGAEIQYAEDGENENKAPIDDNQQKFLQEVTRPSWTIARRVAQPCW